MRHALAPAARPRPGRARRPGGLPGPGAARGGRRGPGRCAGPADAGPATWRSALYPADWRRADTDDAGRHLPDFSYAGYHRGERALPEAVPGPVVDVAADPTGATDATAALQAALDAAADAGGGTVHLPAGRYRCDGLLTAAPAASSCAATARSAAGSTSPAVGHGRPGPPRLPRPRPLRRRPGAGRRRPRARHRGRAGRRARPAPRRPGGRRLGDHRRLRRRARDDRHLGCLQWPVAPLLPPRGGRGRPDAHAAPGARSTSRCATRPGGATRPACASRPAGCARSASAAWAWPTRSAGRTPGSSTGSTSSAWRA